MSTALKTGSKRMDYASPRWQSDWTSWMMRVALVAFAHPRAHPLPEYSASVTKSDMETNFVRRRTMKSDEDISCSP